MRKLRYSAGVKAMVILLQELCAIVLVICIILISTLLSRSMLDFGDLKNKKDFTESVYYEEMFKHAVGEVMGYIEYQEQFETDGVYNPGKAVNILAYKDSSMETENIRTSLSNSERFLYYLEDLENWSKEYKRQEGDVYSRLYLSQEGELYQQQKLFINGVVTWETDKKVENLKEVAASFKEQIVSVVEGKYHVVYPPKDYRTDGMEGTNITVFSEVTDTGESVVHGVTRGAQDTDIDETDTAQGTINENTVSGDAAAQATVNEAAATEQTGNESTAAEQAANEGLYQAIQKVENGQLFELQGQELKEILTDINITDIETSEKIPVIEEKYLLVSGTTILSEFLEGHITLNEMRQAYESLEYTLNTIHTEIMAYKRLVNKYENGDSNLQFLIYSEEKNHVYTNLQEMPQVDLLSYGKGLGSYFYYNEKEIRLDTSIRGLEEKFYDYFDSRNGGYNNVIFIGVDTAFSNKDVFWEAKTEYNQLQPWAVISLVGTAVSMTGFFFSFVYLSLAAGRRPEDDEVHIIWFDKIKTEFAVLGFGIVLLGIMLVFSRLIDLFDGSDMMGMMVMAGGLTFVIVAVFMIFYMSFVRRIRAGIMWSGSVLCWIGRGIQKVIRNWKPSIKIIAFFAVHTMITLILAVLAIQVWWYSKVYALFILSAYLLLCGGEALFFLREGVQRNMLIDGIKRIAGGDLEYEIDIDLLKGDNKAMGEAINTIGEGLYHAVDDSIKNERLKADLITNVSHDIKTPITSIINYVDLLKRENLDNERANNYISVLDTKSQRLKQLTEDLVEASKISSGNITLQMDRLNFVELVYQTAGEFNEKFEARGLTAVTRLPKEPVIILADGRRSWRVIENLYNNVAKYAMENTRVYVNMEVQESVVEFSIKNISQQPLNIEASELTERFIRGDVSRSTEGSGLGLSIAQNLTKLMGGDFEIYLDGDLFKVTVTFPVAKGE